MWSRNRVTEGRQAEQIGAKDPKWRGTVEEEVGKTLHVSHFLPAPEDVGT